MNVIELIKQIWHRVFLEERSSLSLSLFRIVAAGTVGLVVIPTLVNLPDNYLQTAFKTTNPQFFTTGVIQFVQRSPDPVVYGFTVLFYLSWLFALIGFLSQISFIAMTVCCYYFYALNAFHVGTLSWDILLVTVFLMCTMNYHGDYFSLDCLFRKDVKAFQKKRPFFLQRLLQFQLAATFFYTALYKTTAEGNWFTDNPIWYLANYPPEGVVKWVLFKEWFAAHPAVCYWSGVFIVVMEYTLPFLLFIPKTRRSAIALGIVWQVLLIICLDVPATFFWLFPAMFLLFINPDKILEKIEIQRARNERAGRARVVYDGNCAFCRASVLRLEIMDLFGRIEKINYHDANLEALAPGLSPEKLQREIHLIDPDGTVTSGFFIFRKLSLMLPMLYPLIPVVYFPGSSLLGPLVYRIVAANRYKLFFWRRCDGNTCAL